MAFFTKMLMTQNILHSHMQKQFENTIKLHTKNYPVVVFHSGILYVECFNNFPRIIGIHASYSYCCCVLNVCTSPKCMC